MAAPLLPFDPSGPSPSPSRSPRRGSRRRHQVRQAYKVPDFLRGIQVLNLVELTGSQIMASRTLGLHQSSISRTLRSLQSQLQLTENSHPLLRFGHNACLGHLRLALRAHRLEGGWLQLSADPLHQSLLRHLPGELKLPATLHGVDQLVELVRLAVLDAALVSSLAFEVSQDPLPRFPGLQLLEIGEMALQLMAYSPVARAVLVPQSRAAPGLHAQLVRRSVTCQVAPSSLRGRRAWLRMARLEGLALPLCPALCPAGWLKREGLVVVPQQRPLEQRLWLLLSEDLPQSLLERCRLRLQRRCAWVSRPPSDLGQSSPQCC